MPGEGGAFPGGPYRRTNLIFRLISQSHFYPVCVTILLLIVLKSWERTAAADANHLLKLFQGIWMILFVALLFRLLLRPEQQNGADGNISKPKHSLAGDARLWFAIAAATITYLRTFPISFLCDGFAHLERVRGPFSLSIWPEFTKGQDGVFYRPLAFLSLFLDYRLWHEWIPGYHLTSIILHLLCVAGVFCLCVQLELENRVSFAAALLFAVVPVAVQTVTWEAARFDQLAAVFGIWSIVCAAKFRLTGEYRSIWGAIALFVLAVLCKENAYIIPVLWTALEVIPLVKSQSERSFRKRAVPLTSYLAAAIVMFVLRVWLLGSVGGYRSGNETIALHVPLASAFGLLVRAPAETLFGYDWLEPGTETWILSVLLTSAVFLMLAFRAKTDTKSRRLILFALIWILGSAAPAHFYFWSADPGLFVSRTLYFGSIGVGILIAVLLDQAVPSPKMFYGWTLFIASLLFAGAQHNISAWQKASMDAKNWLATLKRQQPDPPRHVTYYIKGVPDQDRGVPFFAAGLESAVRSNYSWREDIHVVSERNSTIPSDAIVINYQQPEE